MAVSGQVGRDEDADILPLLRCLEREIGIGEVNAEGKDVKHHTG